MERIQTPPRTPPPTYQQATQNGPTVRQHAQPIDLFVVHAPTRRHQTVALNPAERRNAYGWLGASTMFAGCSALTGLVGGLWLTEKNWAGTVYVVISGATEFAAWSLIDRNKAVSPRPTRDYKADTLIGTALAIGAGVFLGLAKERSDDNWRIPFGLAFVAALIWESLAINAAVQSIRTPQAATAARQRDADILMV